MKWRGLSTIELMVALSILVFSIATSSTLSLSASNSIADAEQAANALNSSYLSLQMGPVHSEPLEDEQFFRWSSNSEWTTWNGESRAVSFSAIQGSSTAPTACDPFTSGDWSNPRRIQTYDIEGPSFYDIASLSTTPGYLVVGAASTSESSAPDLFLYKLSGSSTPRLEIAFDSASTSRMGVVATTDGQRVFGGRLSSSHSSLGTSDPQVSIYRINHSLMEFDSSITFSTTTPPYASQIDGTASPVSALAYYRGYLYVGLHKTYSGDEFDIIDVRNGQRPRWIAGYRIGRTVTDISVRGALAYVSTDDPERELMVFDVSDHFIPALVASWDAPGTPTFGYGSASTVYGDLVRFGRSYISGEPEFSLLRLAPDDSFEEIGSIDSGTSKEPESVRALLTQDRITFMLLTHRLDILDTHDPLHVRKLSSYSLPPDSRGAALACRNNQLFLGRNAGTGQGAIDILQGA